MLPLHATQTPLYQSTVCQKLPADLQAKVDSFHEFIEKQATEHNVLPDHIINFDEVCSWYLILCNKFLNKSDL